MLCFVVIFQKPVFFFSKEKQEEVYPGGRRGREELGGVEGRKIVFILYFVRKESEFCKKKAVTQI